MPHPLPYQQAPLWTPDLSNITTSTIVSIGRYYYYYCYYYYYSSLTILLGLVGINHIASEAHLHSLCLTNSTDQTLSATATWR